MLILNQVMYQRQQTDYYFDFQLAANQHLVISGESGVGKSTLLDLIAGFLPLNSGSILWHDKDITRELSGRRPLSILFQQHNLFNHLSVFKNIALGLTTKSKLSTAQTQQVHSIIEQMGLDNEKMKTPKELSGGQQQRAALARTLLRAQPILLLDEALVGLDEDRKKQLIGIINDHQKAQGCAVIWVTHHPEELSMLNNVVYKNMIKTPVAERFKVTLS